MKSNYCLLFLLLAAMFIAIAPQVTAKDITTAQARQVAANQLKLVTVRDGAWGDRESARLGSMEMLQENDRLLGYLFHIEPVGYIIVSPYRELAPIRGYSTRSSIDLSESGLLIQAFKALQEMVHDGVANRLGRKPTPNENFANVIDVEFESAWSTLLDPAFNPSPPESAGTRSAGMNYQEGETLLSTSWNQSPPYNDMCPDHGCTWETFDGYNSNAWAGCVATAGAQVLKYWNWPPVGEGSGYDYNYDWPNMGNRYIYSPGDAAFWIETDDGWEWATQAHIDAVALIQRKVGVAVDMDYGCNESGAYTHDLEDAFEDHFRIVSSMNKTARENCTYNEWVHIIRYEMDDNQPVVYRIPGHAIVADGWEEDLGTYLFHIVYGHNGSNDGWFATTEIPGGGNTDDHYIMEEIRPEYSVSDAPYGLLSLPAVPYRCFNKDVLAIDCQFAAGHNLQVVRSGLAIESEDISADFGITFESTPDNKTVFFFDGDPANKSSIKINDGTIRLTQGGAIAIH